MAEYVFSPDYAFLKTPLLCVSEAKREDFMQGQAQRIAEMVVCRWNNQRDKRETEIVVIVSNGQTCSVKSKVCRFAFRLC